MYPDNSTPEVYFTGLEFEIIFQVMKEAPNFSEDRLQAAGCSDADLRLMMSLLRPIDRRPVRARDVCFEFSDGDLPNSLEDLSSEHVRCRLPRRFAQWWRPVAELITLASSPRELFLRTGYQFEQIRSMVARLPESES